MWFININKPLVTTYKASIKGHLLVPLLMIKNTLFSSQQRISDTTVNTRCQYVTVCANPLPLVPSVYWDRMLIRFKICFVRTHNPHLNSKPLPVQIWGAAANPAPPSGRQREQIYNQCSVKTAQDRDVPLCTPPLHPSVLSFWAGS